MALGSNYPGILGEESLPRLKRKRKGKKMPYSKKKMGYGSKGKKKVLYGAPGSKSMTRSKKKKMMKKMKKKY